MTNHFLLGGYPNPDPHYISPEEEKRLENLDQSSCAGCGLDGTDRCPHCLVVTCGECQNCEHGPSLNRGVL